MLFKNAHGLRKANLLRTSAAGRSGEAAFLVYKKFRKNSFARSDVNETMLATRVQAQSDVFG